MNTGGIFTISRGTRIVFFVTVAVSMAAVTAAFIYYRGLNRTEDPRIREARLLLLRYEDIKSSDPLQDVFSVLDSAASIFRRIPDYRNSFEPGIVYNNKCTLFLLTALYDSTVSAAEKQSLLIMSMAYCDSSIIVYENWIREWGTLQYEDIEARLIPYMNAGDTCFQGLNFERIFDKRVKSLVDAGKETPRRLSVSLTNKATIFRHQGLPDSSLLYLKRAIALWSENRTARSNLNVLLGGQPVKPSVIESLFPPERIGKN